jgi:transcriptional regulator GlxA family with amidase domain
LPVAISQLERVTAASFDQIRIYPETATLIRESVTGAIVDAIASSSPSLASGVRNRFLHRGELVKRADQFLRQRIGHRYSSRGLCEFLGMSERNLQLYFQQAFGMGPKKWFLHLSLQRAHAELLHCRNPTPGIIAEIALHCGFEHFGRFAQGYRELYGELPSRTLKSRR